MNVKQEFKCNDADTTHSENKGELEVVIDYIENGMLNGNFVARLNSGHEQN